MSLVRTRALEDLDRSSRTTTKEIREAIDALTGSAVVVSDPAAPASGNRHPIARGGGNSGWFKACSFDTTNFNSGDNSISIEFIGRRMSVDLDLHLRTGGLGIDPRVTHFIATKVMNKGDESRVRLVQLGNIFTIYINCVDPWDEIGAFLKASSDRYNLISEHTQWFEQVRETPGSGRTPELSGVDLTTGFLYEKNVRVYSGGISLDDVSGFTSLGKTVAGIQDATALRAAAQAEKKSELIELSSSRNMTAGDIGNSIQVLNSGITYTIPANTNFASDGEMVMVFPPLGASTRISPASGVTIHYRAGQGNITGTFDIMSGGVVTLYKRNSSTWYIFGAGIVRV